MESASIATGGHDTGAFSLTRMIYAVCGAIMAYEICGLVALVFITRSHGFPLDRHALWLSLYGADLFFVVTMLSATVAYRPKSELFCWRVLSERPGNHVFQSSMWGLLGGLAALLLASPLFWAGDGQLRPITFLMADALSPARVFKLAFVVLALALSGEVVYRGIVFRTLEQYASAPAAVFASCMVFAVICPVFSYPAAIILGAISAILFYRTRSLLAPIIANVLFTFGGSGIMLYRSLMHA